MPTASEFAAACQRGDVGSIKRALAAEDPTLRPSQDDLDRGLYDAASSGNHDLVKLLFANGGRITGLTLAGLSHGQHPALYKEFLDQGWDPNTQFNQYNSPLLRLCTNVDCSRVLLEHGADPNIVGPRGVTPMSSALIVGNVELLDLLLSHNAILDPQLIFTALSPLGRNAEVATRFLLDKGVDVNTLSQRWGTPLHFAVRHRQKSMVKLLLDAGADPSIKFTQEFKYPDMTPAALAEAIGEIEIHQMIREAEIEQQVGDIQLESN